MKKNLLFLAAMTSVALVSCTNDEFADSSPNPTGEETQAPIVFGSQSKAFTRADFVGKDAATKLGNKFVVSAKKGSTTADTDGKIVFDNYVVEYAENTAHTTASNVANWEYVGKGRIKHATDHGITSQTIKYWDYSKDQYDFIAWSTGSKEAIYSGTPSAGQVLVSAINPNATATAAYTFKGSAADLSECYISDLVTVKKAQYSNHENENPVTLTFRQLGTKVRVGIYETIPGYSVKDVKFYTAADVALAGNATDDTPRLFTTTANNIFTSGIYTVTFPTVDDTSSEDNNQAHVSFDAAGASQSTIVDWGGLNYTIAEEGEKIGTKFLGRTSATASFAGNADDNYYVVFLPNEDGTNLNLRVNYTLEAIDGSGEEIEVKGATAQVPSIYTTWKPGFAYTYLFKISDKTNGYTGAYDPTKPDDTTVNSDPAGLYPITFDAIVVNAEDNDVTQETITLVATPSITTYQKGSNVVNNNEYLAATGNIFVTVNDGGGYVEVTGLTAGDDVSSYYKIVSGNYTKCGGSEIADGSTTYYRLDPVLANGALQTLTGKAALYTIPAGKTEADVVDALQMQDDDAAPSTIKGRSGLVLTNAAFTLTNSVEYGADGNAISVGTDQALRFTPSAGTYAFVYTKTASTTTTDKFQPVTKAVDALVNGLYRFAYKAATHSFFDDLSDPDPLNDIEYFDAQKGVKYFLRTGATAPYTYTMQTPFIGQGVSNLYLDAAGNTIASGYAVTGTDYYYTTDHGMTYTKATNIAYEDFKTTTLYKDAACTDPRTETTPADGQAYYDSTGKYCVILPQQTKTWYELDTNTYVAADEATAVDGQTYFDKYTKNDGVYYTKIIKVQ